MTLVLHDQTTFSDRRAGTYGDCARACVATILQCPAEDFPHPIGAGGAWNTAWFKALRDRGLALRSIDYDPDCDGETVIRDIHWGGFRVPRIVIATGPSPRGVRHAVVWDRLARRMIHDPHPSRKGIGRIASFDYLGPWPRPDA